MPFDSRDLNLELLDPGITPLVRLFRHPNGQWDPPPEKNRSLRVDPPDPHKSAYAVLYMAESIDAVAVECHILAADASDHYTWNSTRAADYRVARYTFAAPALFLPIDGPNHRRLAPPSGWQIYGADHYQAYQRLGHELFQRYGNVVHGLSWQSFHRNQPGRVYALWHHHKKTIDLQVSNGPVYPLLANDPEWQAFLLANPDIAEIR